MGSSYAPLTSKAESETVTADTPAAAASLSPSIISILNSCAKASTREESEAVMQRVRDILFHSPNSLSHGEQGILHGLLIREAELNGSIDTSKPTTTQAFASPSAHPTSISSGAHGALPSLPPSAGSEISQPDTKIDRVKRNSQQSQLTMVARSDKPADLHVIPADEAESVTSSRNGTPITSNSVTTSTHMRPTSVEVARDHEDDRVVGDEEMKLYIERYQARKLSQGAKQADLDRQFEFPDPFPPSREFSVRQAEVMFGNKLCEYELKEMYDTMRDKKIYYAGTTRKHIAYLKRPDFNYGYDDDRGDYKVVLRDHLAYRYEVVQTLGRGSFGQVLKCKDHKTGKWVAVKLIRNKQRFQHQALVETKILEQLVDWDPENKHHVVHIVESFYFRNHLCIAMELMSINLYELIKCNSFAGCSVRLVRRFTRQALRALILTLEHKVVHCDLKPENILLTNPRKSEIKVIDFGSSCFQDQKVYTYIQSRFYRSPEVILGTSYSMGMYFSFRL